MIIDKVIVSYQQPDDMEAINRITGLEYDNTDNWVDYGTFKEHPILNKFVEEEEGIALKNGTADFIAFRIDL